MRRHLSLYCILAAWLCANGAALDVVQGYAWMRMFAGYARTAPLACAAAETFDPSRLCPICKAVQKSRDDGARQPEAVAVERIMLLASQRSEIVLTRPAARPWPEMRPEFAPEWRQPVAVPPPKSRLA